MLGSARAVAATVWSFIVSMRTVAVPMRVLVFPLLAVVAACALKGVCGPVQKKILALLGKHQKIIAPLEKSFNYSIASFRSGYCGQLWKTCPKTCAGTMDARSLSNKKWLRHFFKGRYDRLEKRRACSFR